VATKVGNVPSPVEAGDMGERWDTPSRQIPQSKQRLWLPAGEYNAWRSTITTP
jgi:hypothetical protein